MIHRVHILQYHLLSYLKQEIDKVNVLQYHLATSTRYGQTRYGQSIKSSTNYT